MDSLKILFATDFSETSKLALDFMCEIEKLFTIDVLLLHVIDSFWKDWFSSGIYEKEVQQRLETWQQKLTNSGGLNNRTSIQKGNAANAILHEAKDHNANLIVMGGDSEASPSHFLTGTTAASVVRSAEQSVILIKSTSCKKILCGFDGSEHAISALQLAVKICQKLNAELTIVFAVPRMDFNPLGMSDKDIVNKEDTLKAQKVADMETILSNIDLSGIKVEKHFPWGQPSRVILDMAEDFDHDLVIIGAKGHSSLTKTLMGSTAEKILAHVPCSLLVVR